MHPNRVLQTLATELPTILRQLESTDPALRSAAVQRLRDFAGMTEPWRAPAARQVSRRGLLRAGVGATFVAMAVGREE